MKWLVLGAFLLPFAGAGQAACHDGSLMQNAARGLSATAAETKHVHHASL